MGDDLEVEVLGLSAYNNLLLPKVVPSGDFAASVLVHLYSICGASLFFVVFFVFFTVCLKETRQMLPQTFRVL